MRKRAQFDANEGGIEELTIFVETTLKSCNIKKNDVKKIVLVAEEAAGSLVSHIGSASGDSPSDEKINVIVRSFMGSVSIDLSARGDEYDMAGNMSVTSIVGDGLDDIQDTIRNILLKAYTDGIKYRHKKGINHIRMTAVRSKQAFLYQTLGAMIAAIVCGLLLSSFAPEGVNNLLNKEIFVPVKTMYMNSLKMIVAPVVFFSIISCIVQFSDLTALGRIGGKIISMYVVTTFIAVFVGISVYFLFQPVEESAFVAKAITSDASAITSQTMDVSIKDTIVGIIPSDCVRPFLESNMLQLIFMAIISGIAAGGIGKYSNTLIEFFSACNDLFLKITSLIIKVMPVAVFCSIMSMMLTMGMDTIISVMGMFGVFLFGLVCMMLVYCTLMIIIGHLNPVPFVRKYAPAMIQVFSMASSNASIPINMDACENKLGISKRIFTLSIPLGATLNMDGTCVHLAVFSLALARGFGVEITGATILSMVISIVVLSMGAPGIPGSGLICLSVLLIQIGVPADAIGLVMGIDSLCGMFRCMSNCLGDVIASSIVAKSENELDMVKYYS